MSKIIFHQALDEESFTVTDIEGNEIVYASYDLHGWRGMGDIRIAVEKMAALAGLEVEIQWESDE